MKLQNLTIIFVIIIIPIILILSFYISTGIKTIKYQGLYDEGLLNATHDAIYAFEQNTANNEYSDNPETKRDILKASIKMFEKSLCNTCNISAYNTEAIEEYIPAIVFCMYDGFYLYAPSYNAQTGKYEHSLKNYVYYSETLEGAGYNGTDVVIRYTLDNYITVLGNFDDDEDNNGEKDGYKVKSGYLIYHVGKNNTSGKYKGIQINQEEINSETNLDAINYYEKGKEFTKWFMEESGLPDYDMYGKDLLFNINNSTNDPEDENSIFVQHKRTVIKEKIESVINSSITAYSERSLSKDFKMPKLSDEDWDKIYSNISMITFFQGKEIGLTQYNGYCVLNSTNSNEYVNPNLMYFIDDKGYYHDIRCSECLYSTTLTGYKIGAFEPRKVTQIDDAGEARYKYVYDHNELACYNCVNGQIETDKTIWEYINDEDTDEEIKRAYWTSLGRERYNTVKLEKNNLIEEKENLEIGDYVEYNVTYKDMYANIEFTKENGWRYLGRDETGNNLIVSTGIPANLNYYSYDDVSADWWDEDETKNKNTRATDGMKENFENIVFYYSLNEENVDKNTGIYKRINANDSEDEEITGEVFRANEYNEKIKKVRMLTLEDINRVTNTINKNNNRTETCAEAGFEELAEGLFDMRALEGYNEYYYYWLANPYISCDRRVYYVSRRGEGAHGSYGNCFGVRPVIVISPDISLKVVTN